MLAALLRPWFEQRTLDEVRVGLDASKVLWGPYRTIEQFVTDPDSLLHETDLMVDVEQPGIGTYPVPRSVLEFSGWDPGPPAPAAETVGEDTDEVLPRAPEASTTVPSPTCTARDVIGGCSP